MTNNTGSDPEFGFRSSPPNHQQIITTNFVSASSPPDATANLNQNPRKKRSKLIKVDDGSGGGGGVSVSKPKYVKRPDPDAPKITMPCSECGKRFWSMKALFGHMRCHPERQWRGINPPPNLRRPTAGHVSSSSSPPVKEIIIRNVESMMMMTMEDHEAAASLLMLAYGGSAGTSGSDVGGDQFYTNTNTSECQQNDLNCRFECSSCKKVFGSHQALGGHRASHKNVKGCFAMTTKSSDGCCEVVDDQQDIDRFVVVKENAEDCYDDGDDQKKKMEMMVFGGHKCSICLRVFSSGQALGGHKRCHWEKLDEPSVINHDHGLNNLFDLNLPAPVEDVDSASSSYSSVLTLDLRLGL
ncbi:hypothetical protein Dsin_026827 [Dipteronia sinensis]|uniref:C2H2-type domain-containing protein n=1 Tax=Dipteronia sinensis TaxID=43782 RepID=A0AAD9ZYE1_9ROSI|nr:hypothetical protein Dsin_026827 [Dipteronia sinensis]